MTLQLITTLAKGGDASVEGGLILTIVGMLVVFTSLSVLMFTVLAISRTRKEKAAQPATPAQPATEASTGGTPVVDKELIAVLSAAVTVVVRRPARIRKVRFMGYVPGTPHGWVVQGRNSLMTGRRTPSSRPRR